MSGGEMTEREELAEQLHEWYLQATKKLNPESYNQKSQKPYRWLSEEQQSIDLFIADAILKWHNEKTEPYVHHRAIQYAFDKLGLKWDSNRQRLNFIEYFDEYIKSCVENK
jgi:hypothetical protein